MAFWISRILVFGDYSGKWDIFGIQTKKMDLNMANAD